MLFSFKKEYRVTTFLDHLYLNPKHLTKDGQLKPRRPLPHVMESDFFDSIVETDDGRFIFSGILNGWPAMTELEVISITCSIKSLIGPCC